MTKIIITGSIATGKSTVTDYLRSKNYPVVDADQIARQVVAPGQLGLIKLIEEFGEGVLLEDGTLNRKALGELIFKDEIERNTVNQILHPIIFKEMEKEMMDYESRGEKLIFIDIPLFYETNSQIEHDEVWLVYTDEKTQIQRLMNRNKIDEGEAKVMIASQMSIETKKNLENIVIDNSQNIETTFNRIDQELNRLLAR